MRFTHVHTNTTHDDEAHNPRLRYDAYTFDERYARDCDVSGSWREEYAAQGVDPDAHDLVTDGGTTFTAPEPGAIAHDQESTHGDDRLLVLGVREETTAESEYIQQIGKTVAEVNPEYSPRAPVARCVYYDEVATVDPEASMDDVRSAVELDIFNSYTFPVDRLALGDTDAAGGDDQ